MYTVINQFCMIHIAQIIPLKIILCLKIKVYFKMSIGTSYIWMCVYSYIYVYIIRVINYQFKIYLLIIYYTCTYGHGGNKITYHLLDHFQKSITTHILKSIRLPTSIYMWNFVYIRILINKQPFIIKPNSLIIVTHNMRLHII